MSLYHKWLKELEQNDPQWEAFNRQAHTVVIAGPGSGKTRVLAMKVAQLLRDEIRSPQGVVCLTYTRMMARELEYRLWALGVEERANVFVGTVHGFCLAEVVQPFSHLYVHGLPSPLRIAPKEVQDLCLDQARRAVYGKEYDPDNNGNFKRRFARCRRQNADLPYSAWKRNKDIAQIVERYERDLYQRGYIDFDVIVHTGLRLIIDHALVRESLRAKFPWFAVDEYQDLGYPLSRIVTEMIAHTSVKLFAIGDPDQSIFDFAGTDPKYLNELAEREEVKPKIVLERNYRATQELINISKTILNADRRYYSPETGGRCQVFECVGGIRHQADIAAKLIAQYRRQGVRADQIAVLHRRRRNGVNIIAEVWKDYPSAQSVPFVLDKHPRYDRTMGIIKWLEDLGYWCLRGWTIQDPSTTDIYRTFDDLLRTWQSFGLDKMPMFNERTNHARVHLARVLWNLQDPEQLLGSWLSMISQALWLDTLFEHYQDTYPDEVDEFYHLRDMASPGGLLVVCQASFSL